MTPPTMMVGERAKLLDAAMRSKQSLAYLDGMQSAFEQAGREGDARLAAVLRELLRRDEVEVALRMRAEWAGGVPLRRIRKG